MKKFLCSLMVLVSVLMVACTPVSCGKAPVAPVVVPDVPAAVVPATEEVPVVVPPPVEEVPATVPAETPAPVVPAA